ncbi:MAG: RagB/SusD family nutrient uptake outer membrane protein, partial [Muribaculaceae bacterium]|nr:RagB/SusD family nutrient uptake outer membrane protein [Muribaculaceae bacterium]
MKSKINKSFMLMIAVALLSVVTSCVDDLDTIPIDKDDLVSEKVFGADIQAYEESLAKIYAGLVIG